MIDFKYPPQTNLSPVSCTCSIHHAFHHDRLKKTHRIKPQFNWERWQRQNDRPNRLCRLCNHVTSTLLCCCCLAAACLHACDRVCSVNVDGVAGSIAVIHILLLQPGSDKHYCKDRLSNTDMVQPVRSAVPSPCCIRDQLGCRFADWWCIPPRHCSWFHLGCCNHIHHLFDCCGGTVIWVNLTFAEEQCSILVQPASSSNPKLRPTGDGVEPLHKLVMILLLRSLDWRFSLIINSSHTRTVKHQELCSFEVPHACDQM